MGSAEAGSVHARRESGKGLSLVNAPLDITSVRCHLLPSLSGGHFDAIPRTAGTENGTGAALRQLAISKSVSSVLFVTIVTIVTLAVLMKDLLCLRSGVLPVLLPNTFSYVDLCIRLLLHVPILHLEFSTPKTDIAYAEYCPHKSASLVLL